MKKPAVNRRWPNQIDHTRQRHDMETATAAKETPEEVFQRLTQNATRLEAMVITVLLDPWPWLLGFCIMMVPLLCAAFWASSVLLKEEQMARKKAKRKQRKLERMDKAKKT